MDCKAILFDYGGTLDTPGEHWSNVIRSQWIAAGADIALDEFRRVYVMAEKALAVAGTVTPDDTFLTLMRKKITLENSFLASPFPADLCETAAVGCYTYARRNIQAVKPVLERLAATIPIGLVSNFYGNLHTVVADMGIAHLFAAVTDSGCLGIRKPDPRIFIEAMRQLNPLLTPSETLVVGDSIDKDILPAHKAGFLTAHLPGAPWAPSSPRPALPASTIIISSIASLTEMTR